MGNIYPPPSMDQEETNNDLPRTSSSSTRSSTTSLESCETHDDDDEEEEEELEWEEPVQSVQELVREGIREVPERYVRPEGERPKGMEDMKMREEEAEADMEAPPVIDMEGEGVRREIAEACEEWGLFHVVNHRVPEELLAKVRKVARRFFRRPLEEKQAYANAPESLTGYGSRMGTSNTAVLDWGDYFLHYIWPPKHRDMDGIWPDKPRSYRAIIDEYSREIHRLYKVLMSIFSTNLGLEPSYLENAFGDDASHVLRINYYPPCPQPHLTLGLGSHSDAGGLTILLQDKVLGLQVKKGDRWILVKSIPNALSINIGDQLQIISNGKYKSVEHRCIVNQHKPRMTIAVFCNPGDDTVISPAPNLLDENSPPLYRSMTFGEFLESFFKKGLDGKGYVESFRTNIKS